MNSIAVLPDGSALVGGDRGVLYHAAKGPDGNFSLGKRIEGFVGMYGHVVDVNAIATLPDGSALVGGDRGALCHAVNLELSVTALKQNLDKIVSKDV